jgi:RecB family exonuclease
LIVTSFNEGFVPTSVNSDLFLPNALRKRLKLLDNQRRYARDAYAVQCLAASRRQVLFVVGRRDQRGDPLIPSRLAFADDPQVVAERVLSIFQPQGTEQPMESTLSDDFADFEPTKFVVPAPVQMPTVYKLPVTALRAYLQCPYRFYLQYVVGLEQLDDELEELDAATFGNLLHQVLREFGSGPSRHATDGDIIRQALEQALDEIVDRQFGANRLAPVNVQLRQLRTRLQGFAGWQARWASEGWRIHDVEVPCQTTLEEATVDGRALQLVGRLDRIDRNEHTGRWLILDYKSSDAAQSPEKNHFRAGRWVDLQLPLYRRLSRQAGVPADAGLGYILLPKDITRVGAAIAQWSPRDLDDAERAACEVARMILSSRFWPPAMDVTYDDYAWICQQDVFHRQLAVVT